MPALVLIITGSICIIMTANYSEVELTVEKMKYNFAQPKTICFFLTALILISFAVVFIKRMMAMLADFEIEVE